MVAFLPHDSEPKIHTTAELKGCRLGRFVSIGARTILRDVEVADFSYFERHGEAIYTAVGKFCSIAANVRINALQHPMERVTTHKITYRPNEYFRFHGVDAQYRARRQEMRVTIGHDVWIGHGAVIMPGITVGDGAVIGANAVVTRDVAPYAIVAGAPARHLRNRFAPKLADALRQMAWWDWPHEKLADALPDMQSLAPEEFIDKYAG